MESPAAEAPELMKRSGVSINNSKHREFAINHFYILKFSERGSFCRVFTNASISVRYEREFKSDLIWAVFFAKALNAISPVLYRQCPRTIKRFRLSLCAKIRLLIAAEPFASRVFSSGCRQSRLNSTGASSEFSLAKVFEWQKRAVL